MLIPSWMQFVSKGLQRGMVRARLPRRRRLRRRPTVAGAGYGFANPAMVEVLENRTLLSGVFSVANTDNSQYVVEGNPGTGGLVSFTVKLTGPTSVTTHVQYNIQPGTATNPSDYIGPASGSLTFAPVATGSSSQAVVISIVGDSVPEPNENFFFNLTSSDGGTTIGTGTAEMTILNDDPLDAVTAPPAVTAFQSLILVQDGDTATTAGTFAGDPNAGAVTISASIGTITQTTGGSGTWGWSLGTSDATANQTVTITATDGVGGVSTTGFQLAINHPPTAVGDSYTLRENTTLTVNGPGVLANDSDMDGDSLFVGGYYSASHGTVGIFTDGSFSYKPDPNFVGTDSFSYDVLDGHGDFSRAFGQVTLTVTAPPTVTVDQPAVLVQAGDTATDTGTFTSDPNAGALTINASIGTVTRTDGDTGTWSWSLGTSGVTTSQTVTITATDSVGGVSTTSFQLAVNHLPVAVSDSYAVSENTTLAVCRPGVLANDSDVDGDALFVAGYFSASHGTVGIFTDGTFNYRPDANFVGTDIFAYALSDGHGNLSRAFGTVHLTVTAPPAVVTNQPTVSAAEGAMATNSGTFIGDLTAGPVTITASIGTVTQTPGDAGGWNWSLGTSDFNQSQVVTITATDGDGGVTSTTFNLAVKDVAPTLTLNPVAPVVVNDNATLTGNFADPGVLDPHVVVINWGDSNGATRSTFAVGATSTLAAGQTVASSTDGAVLTITAVDPIAGTASFSVQHQYTQESPSPAGNVIGGTITDGAGATTDVTTVAAGPASIVVSGVNNPSGLAFDGSGNLYVASNADGTVVRVTPAGDVSTFVAGLNHPAGLAFDTAGNLYVAEGENGGRITKVAPDGEVSLFSFGFYYPKGLAFDSSGALYTTDYPFGTVDQVTPNGTASHFATFGGYDAFGVAVDAAGNVYVSNLFSGTITKITPDATVSTYASGLNFPMGMAFDSLGNLYVANNAGHSVSQVTPAGVVSTFLTGFNNPDFLAFDGSGHLYVADDTAGTVTKVGLNVMTTPTVTSTVMIADPPIATTAAVAENTPLALTAADLQGNEANIVSTSGPFAVTTVSGATNGSVVLQNNGTVTFTPDANFIGTAGFDYTISDGGPNAVGHITITVAAPPVVTADRASLLVQAGDTATDTGTFAADPNAGAVTMSASIGTITQTAGDTGTWGWSLDSSDTTASQTVTITATDSLGGVSTTSFQLAINHLPVAVSDSYVLGENTQLFIPGPGLLANDSDVDGDPLFVAGYYSASHGTVGTFTDGSFNYKPDANFVGTDSFYYELHDGHGDSSRAYALVTLTVTAPPVVTANQSAILVQDGDTATDTGTFAGDPNAGAVTMSASIGTITQTAGGNGTWSWSLGTSDATANQTVTITATDSVGGVSTTSFQLAVNHPPVARDHAYVLTANSMLNVNAPDDPHDQNVIHLSGPDLLANDTDADGDPLAVVGAYEPSHGDNAVFTGGGFIYTPNPGFVGTDSFVYVITDGHGPDSTGTATVTLTVTAPPAVTVDQSSILVQDGDTATDTGTFAGDPNAGAVAISASIGTISQTAGSNGTWSWSLGTSDATANQTVTITATDSVGGGRPRASNWQSITCPWRSARTIRSVKTRRWP